MTDFTRGELSEIQANVRPQGRLKTVTFSAVAGSGAQGTVKLFAITGAVVGSLRGYCETDLTGASATLVHGISGSTSLFIPIITGTTIDAGYGIDSTGLVPRGVALAVKPTVVFAGDIIATVATADVTAGKIHYVFDYVALTADATVTPY